MPALQSPEPRERRNGEVFAGFLSPLLCFLLVIKLYTMNYFRLNKVKATTDDQQRSDHQIRNSIPSDTQKETDNPYQEYQQQKRKLNQQHLQQQQLQGYQQQPQPGQQANPYQQDPHRPLFVYQPTTQTPLLPDPAHLSWRHGLFGCFDNVGLSVITFLLPCYAFTKNAQAVGEPRWLCCLLYAVPCLNCVAVATVRGRIRLRSGNIEGGVVSDLMTHLFCHPCALVQETQEVRQLCTKVTQIQIISRQ